MHKHDMYTGIWRMYLQFFLEAGLIPKNRAIFVCYIFQMYECTHTHLQCFCEEGFIPQNGAIFGLNTSYCRLDKDECLQNACENISQSTCIKYVSKRVWNFTETYFTLAHIHALLTYCHKNACSNILHSTCIKHVLQLLQVHPFALLTWSRLRFGRHFLLASKTALLIILMLHIDISRSKC